MSILTVTAIHYGQTSRPNKIVEKLRSLFSFKVFLSVFVKQNNMRLFLTKSNNVISKLKCPHFTVKNIFEAQ